MKVDDEIGGERSQFLKNRENRNHFDMIEGGGEHGSSAPQDVGYEKALSLIGKWTFNLSF